ncbi:MAG: UPF0182 family protein [Chlorobia bacterium]|nr:UPF0182 family protein [Fimbriimonadaceae bacterium]
MDPNRLPPIELDPAKVRMVARRGCGCGLFLFVFIFLLGALGPYTDYLWFKHDVQHPEVMTIGYGTQSTLFLIGFVVSLSAFYFSLRVALKQSMVYFDRPISFGQKIVTNAMGWIQEKGTTIVKVIAVIFALFSGFSLAGEWQTWLLSRNAVSFGKVDPLLGIDLGFYAFTLPWYQAMANYLFGLALTTSIVTLVLYVGLQMLAALAKIELGRPQVRWHISILVSVLAIAYGVQSWLNTYSFGTMPSAQFTGAGYSTMSELTALKAVAIVSFFVAIVSLVSVRAKVPYKLTIGSGVLLGATYIVGVMIIPTIIQRVVVEPDKIAKEGPYAKNAIEMTRFAYGLDKIDVKDFKVADAPTAAEVKEAKTTLDNMRLWDPEILRRGFDGSQSFRRYYSFNDVDLDRYEVGGKPTMVMLSPRDIALDGLEANARSWVNTRLQYTHGYGLVMSPVNTAGVSGRPKFLISDLPPVGPPELEIKEPRIYFSDFRSPEMSSEDQYALVDTKVDEFDYLTEDKAVTYRWKGGRGIPIGGFFTKLAFSIVMADGNLLVSGNITGQSKLLMNRSVLTRASKTYPFLKFDNDPYLVIHEGRLIWILDGYSVNENIPYASMTEGGAGRINYIRNSVKATIDAYSGEVIAYAIDGVDPVLKAYRGIYPNLVKDFSEFPKGLDAHLRYPEDLLQLQAQKLQQYHVEDTTSFLNNGDAWDIPYQKGTTGVKEPMDPYYVLMRLPNEPKEGFMQILPFTPRQKGNMAGWLAALCDPGSLGKLVLYKYSRGSLIPGPELMDSNFNQNEVISNLNRLLSNDQSELRSGNLLVIPIGQSVMYVEPLFLESKTSGLQTIPELRKVVLALNNKIVVGDTYELALQKLFGDLGSGVEPPAMGNEPKPTTENQIVEPPPTGQPPQVSEVREALKLLDKAEQALRAGDFAKYGELQKQARARLRKIAGG